MGKQKVASSEFKVELRQEGSGGWVFYVERVGKLPFEWEYVGFPVTGISVPAPEEWDLYCEKHGAGWAKGRREEILTRVAEKILRGYGKGSYEISDRWVIVRGGTTLLTRILSFFR